MPDRLALSEDGIEITPEMIEAGEGVIRGRIGDPIEINFSSRELASEVFRAMRNAGTESQR